MRHIVIEWLGSVEPAELGEVVERVQSQLCDLVYQSMAIGSDLNETETAGNLLILQLIELAKQTG